MKHRMLVLTSLLVLALTAGVSAQTGFLTIGSGGTGGVYFPIATGIAKMINDANIGWRSNARSTGGSVFNVTAIQSGELQMALAQNDISFYAYGGTGVEAFIGKPTRKLRGIAILYPEPIHILARRDRGIKTVADMKGKQVYVGDIGSGAEQNSKQVLDGYGLTFADLGQAVRGSATTGVQLLTDGRIDAMFYTVGVGNAAIMQAALTAPIEFLSIDPMKLRDIREKYPFLSAFGIAAGIYRGVDAPVVTVTVQASLVTSSDMSADVVYRVTKLLMDEKVEEFRGIHSNLERYFHPLKALEGMAIPLHPGAVRFYQEKNTRIPERLLPPK
ncbi:MAG: TAXI family TRAP transporter solute-binding subunit [bacterium]|nr:TAXI family TRAP transporter solute-binding subunit [bacterium]